MTDTASSSLLNSIRAQEFALYTCVNLIADVISNCEFKTYLKDKEDRSDEYYLWNYEPNKNENSIQFLKKLIAKLMINNEALVIEVNGQLIIADSFNQNEYAVAENYFTDVVVGTMTFKRSFMMSDVLYFKLNDEDIKPYISNLLSDYNELLNLGAGKYKRSGGRKGIVNIDKIKTGDVNRDKEIDELFNNRFKTYFEAENAVLNLPKGIEYNEQGGESTKKQTSEINDIQALVKSSLDSAAQGYHIPPALLRGDINDVDNLVDNLLTFCIDPITSMMEKEITRKRYGKNSVKNGSYIRIDTTCIKHIDIFKIADSIDKLRADGIYNIDEIRRKVGDAELNTAWSKEYVITKNYEKINGGEKNE